MAEWELNGRMVTVGSLEEQGIFVGWAVCGVTAKQLYHLVSSDVIERYLDLQGKVNTTNMLTGRAGREFLALRAAIDILSAGDNLRLVDDMPEGWAAEVLQGLLDGLRKSYNAGLQVMAMPVIVSVLFVDQHDQVLEQDFHIVWGAKRNPTVRDLRRLEIMQQPWKHVAVTNVLREFDFDWECPSCGGYTQSSTADMGSDQVVVPANACQCIECGGWVPFHAIAKAAPQSWLDVTRKHGDRNNA